jgi:hypothetical protein
MITEVRNMIYPSKGKVVKYALCQGKTNGKKCKKPKKLRNIDTLLYRIIERQTKKKWREKSLFA